MEKQKENTVTITEAEYDQLKEDQKWFECLEAAGVDNWEGWDYAYELFHKDS